jgi:5-methylcytosine-specific restriction endonuclease McrA
MPPRGRRCLGGPGLCADGGLAVPGRSRCRNHGGKAWARQPPERLAQYRSAEYQRNRAIVLARDPLCRLRLPGCTGRSTTVDHVISVARGGGNSVDNLVGACAHCNQTRGGAEGRATVKRRAAERRRTP